MNHVSSTDTPLLVLGTRNAHKVSELTGLLRDTGIRLESLASYRDVPIVPEDGKTFAENAAKKAIGYARHVGQWALGEDSGLVVDALGGAPGIFSARYSGPDATDEANNQRLLEDLVDVPRDKRTAHYICTLAVADPHGAVRLTASGRCDGRILTEPRGTNGFGYDPLFEVIEYHRSFGELGPVVKACLSHRAQAIRSLAESLSAFVKRGEWTC